MKNVKPRTLRDSPRWLSIRVKMDFKKIDMFECYPGATLGGWSGVEPSIDGSDAYSSCPLEGRMRVGLS